MNLRAQINVTPLPAQLLDQYGSRNEQAQVTIDIFNAVTGLPANGNYMRVTYKVTESDGSSSTATVTVAGLKQKIFAGTIGQVRYDGNGTLISSSYKNFEIVSYNGDGSDPIISDEDLYDLVINDIHVDNNESAPGANDAQITVKATSSRLPLAYKLDGVITSASPIFNGLSGGTHAISATDAAGITVNKQVYIPTISNLLVSDPSVTLPDGSISRWNAAFNPVVFTYQRRDFVVTDLQLNTADGNTRVVVRDADLSKVVACDKIYLKTHACEGVFNVKVFDKTTKALIIDTPFLFGSFTATQRSGFININRLRPYYKILTSIRFFDKISGRASNITSTNRPNAKGLVRADISNFLQSLLRANDTSDYTAINFRDDNLSASYQISYAEHWDDDTQKGHTGDFIIIENPYYVLYAAKQLGDKFGGNMAQYVTQQHGLQPAKWLSDFDEPAYSISYPFDLSFIYSEKIAGLQLYYKITALDINRQPLGGINEVSYLLNDDAGYLLQQGSSKFLIARQQQVKAQIAEYIGLNRLLINHDFGPLCHYLQAQLFYNDTQPVEFSLTLNQRDGIIGDIKLLNVVDGESTEIMSKSVNGQYIAKLMPGVIYIIESTAYDVSSATNPKLKLIVKKDGALIYNGNSFLFARSSLNKSGRVQNVTKYEAIATFYNEAGPLPPYFNEDDLNEVESVDLSITEPKVIRIDNTVDNRSVYLRWIGLSGSWNYYRFVYNQEVSLDVQNAVIIKNYVTDWQNQQGIDEVISKAAGQKIKVMAEDISVNDIKGLQSIKYSPKVQLLLGQDPIKWQTVVVNTATYSEYETRNGQAPFSITFSLPAINIQAQ